MILNEKKKKKRRKEKKRSEEKKVMSGIEPKTFDAAGQSFATRNTQEELSRFYY